MHECIWDWTWKWDLALMISTVWPNHRQVIIAVLGGGMVVQFRKSSRGEGQTKWKPRLAHKGDVPVFPTFPVFCGFQLYPLTVFGCLIVIGPS